MANEYNLNKSYMLKKLSLERVVALVTLIYPLTAIPQLYNIWIVKDASGISILTWSMFFILTIPLIMYAIRINEKKLTYMWSAWALIYLWVIMGTFIYG